MSTLHTNVCRRYILEHCIGCRTCPNLITVIPRQLLSCCCEVLVNFEEVFALFLGAFIADFEHPLFFVNVIKCYLMTYLCGSRNRRYIYGSCCKTLVCKWLAPCGVLNRYFSLSCYEKVILNFYYFVVVPIGKSCKMSLMRFYFISLLLKQV